MDKSIRWRQRFSNLENALILSVFHQYPDVDEAIIFGSRAMGNYKPGSDKHGQPLYRQKQK